MSRFPSPTTYNNDVPTLLQSATEKVAKLIEDDELPLSDYQIGTFVSNGIFEELRRNEKLSYRVMEKICTSNQFPIDTIDLAGNIIKQEHLQLCSNLDLVSFGLGRFGDRPSHFSIEVHVPELLEAALNPTSLRNLRHLAFKMKSNVMNEDWPEYVAQRLVSLVSLTIDYEYMTIRTFDLIGANFSHLRHLSVSNAKITDITIISQLTNLEVLVLYRLNISHGNINALAQLHNLRHLDISREMVTNEHTHRAHSNLAIGLHRKSVRAIRNGTEIPWPEMRRINLSGLKVAQFANDNGESVKDIIMAYPKLEQIVLVDVPLDPNLVAGRGVEVLTRGSAKSLKSALSHYIGLGRVDDVYDIMGMIKEEIDNFYSVEDLEECLELVCSILKKDSYNFEIYVGSCFLELCRDRLLEKLSVIQKNYIFDCCLYCLSLQLNSRFNTNLNHTSKIWRLTSKLLTMGITDKDDFRLFTLALRQIELQMNEETEQLVLGILAGLTPQMHGEEELSSRFITNFYLLLEKYVQASCPRNRNDMDEETALRTLRDALSVLLYFIEQQSMTYENFLQAGGFETAVRILSEVTDNNSQIGILKVLFFFAGTYGLKKFTEPDTIRLLLSFVCRDFNEADELKLYQNEERSYIASSILCKLLNVTSGTWRNRIQKWHVSNQLFDTINQYPGLYRPTISFAASFWRQFVAGHCEYLGAITWTLRSILTLLQNDKNQFLTLNVNDNVLYEEMPDFCPRLFLMIQDIADDEEFQEDLIIRLVEDAKMIIELVDEEVLQMCLLPGRNEPSIRIETNQNGERRLVRN